ncbi:uncharacterized protein LOC132754725 [Ruditapes philippinarum]|uniref:uncharacterized protein LOC132754725 n=1 Tax=Ruditapes philippinarum TaxID=129788 RepID=UPI00295AD1A1|nr:uncharacterized protein LOC132754725 [Ruditapes philippinarum]
MEDLVRDDTNSLGDRTHKSKSALSRNKMKTEDPERYRIYLDKQKVTAKQRREELKRELQKKKGNEQSKAKKAHQNEMQRRRQKRYMERKKEQGISIQSSTPRTKAKPQTRNIIETRREYNRQKKRKERQEMSWQKKMWIRKKDRERKKKNRKEAAKLKEIYQHQQEVRLRLKKQSTI